MFRQVIKSAFVLRADPLGAVLGAVTIFQSDVLAYSMIVAVGVLLRFPGLLQLFSRLAVSVRRSLTTFLQFLHHSLLLL